MNLQIQKFLEEQFIANGLNRLPEDYGGGPIFDLPLTGVSRGDDPIFNKFKEVVAPEHLTPAEMWLQSGFYNEDKIDAKLRILSVIFPFAKKVREESKTAQKMPADIYAVARNHAGPFMNDVMQEAARFFQDRGYRAVVATQSKAFRTIEKPNPFRRYAVWSERHIAFAAGLGTFSLHEGLITDVGCNIRISSLITDAPLRLTPRKSDEPYGNCLYYAQGTCKECIDQCPADAITEEGHDKIKCSAYLKTIQKVKIKSLGPILIPIVRQHLDGEKKTYPMGCAFCQFDVPCMDKNPVAENSDKMQKE